MTACLLVIAHPLPGSLCRHLATHVADRLAAAGHTVTLRDLCAGGFDPRLTAGERGSYYTGFEGTAAAEMAELAAAELLVLVFPTWWFGFPAVLKGWFDRVWAPGLAFDHSPGFGPMVPRLDRLRGVVAITTMGVPEWIDRWVMWRPLKRILATAIVRPCAPQARTRWLALYRAEGVGADRLSGFMDRIDATLARAARH